MKKLFNISKNLLRNPVTYWDELAGYHWSRKKVVLEYLLPLSLLVGLCSFLGTLFSEGVHDSLSIGYLLLSGSISFFIILIETYLSGWLITEMALAFDHKTNSHAIFNLVVFSHIPFIATLSLSHLFPPLIFLNILGAYSFYLFWAGIEKFSQLTDERKPVFMIISVIIMLILYFILTMIFNSIYDAVLNQFTTFIS